MIMERHTHSPLIGVAGRTCGSFDVHGEILRYTETPMLEGHPATAMRLKSSCAQESTLWGRENLLFTFAPGDWPDTLDAANVELCTIESESRITAYRVTRVQPTPPGFFAVFETV